MILTAEQIAARGIIKNSVPDGTRRTTYDATVGEIISDGLNIPADEFMLPPRGLVWVVSREEFHVPSDITGLATLRTTWTHDGILALNVGVVDPCWKGPLAAAVVNFSAHDFRIRKGETFFRVMFHQHASTTGDPTCTTKVEYHRMIADKSLRTGSSFLNISSLANEVLKQLLTPSWMSLVVGFLALLIAVAAIFIPIAYGISRDYLRGASELHALQERVSELERSQATVEHRLSAHTTPR